MKSLLSLLLLTAVVGCTTPTAEQPTESATAPMESTVPVNEDRCFRNEVVFPNNAALKDVTELQLSINGTAVTGTYNWLPAEKDQRKGRITGTLDNNVVKGQYTFMQEGLESTTPIQITLSETQAVVAGEDPALGLEAMLPKVDCQ